MKLLKLGLLALAGLFVIFQFFRPTKNLSTAPSASGIASTFTVPSDVQALLRRSCYDCHSNNTVYPWYAEVQPVGWWLNSHITHGKRMLNFDDFRAYPLFRQYHRFGDIIEQVTKDDMPLPSYLIIHRYAKLSPQEKTVLVDWSKAMMDSMKAKYPADSLQRRPRRVEPRQNDSNRQP
jgi:hypothetical protein